VDPETRTCRLGAWLGAALLLATALTGCKSAPDLRTAAMRDDYQTIDINGVKLAYTDTGRGQPLLLVHGFGACRYSWRHVVPHFAPSHRVLTLDLKGFGDSEKPEDDAYAVADQARLVAAFIAALGLTNLTVAGHSLGGAVALMTYLNLAEAGGPQPIRQLILMDSASFPQELPTFMKVLRLPVVNHLALGLAPGTALARWVLEMAFFDHGKITPEMVETYAHYASLPGAHQALIRTAQLVLPDNVEALIRRYGEITVPVLVLWGQEDAIVPLAVGRQLAEALPTARLVVLPRCGHVPQEECPEETLAVLDQFLLTRP